MRRVLAAPVSGLLALIFLVPRPAGAQGLPAYRPINPLYTSRTSLGFVPYRDAAAGRWQLDVGLDYASAIESRRTDSAGELLDGELLRLDLSVSRDLGRRWFTGANVPLQGAYGGVLDGFLHWYHGLIGISMPERDARPRDRFAYQVNLPDGTAVSHRSSGGYLGDARLWVGHRFSRHVQSVLSVTLPTSTSPAGYGLGTVSADLFTTARGPVSSRLLAEGGIGIGMTPRSGELSPVERTVFGNAAGGLRYRFWGRQSLFATLYYGTPAYRRTGLPSLDGADLSLDFGWILRTRSGREWRIGMTEDLRPSGPAVDIVFRLGVR